ncbi:MAG: hypothetical protein KDJ75_09135, partial [Alphaproteobacteria bacterium]|nr:hypothetical protein [Alphaproteobacteria bacterium]
MVKRSGERGNIFFTLFGAVAIVGILGAGVMATMRGPLSTIVEVNNRTRAETQMTIAAKLAMIEAVDTVGDCDSDGYIEPLEHTVAAPNPTGGGQLPAAVGSNKIDPWDTEIGYCAWDAGPDNSTCVGTRLTGSGADDETYTMMAIISAGPDGIFQSSCANHPGLVTKGGDDIVQEYSYADARGATGGLWTLKSGAPGTAEIAKDIEAQAAKFSSAVDLTGPSSQLKLGAASMLLPNEVTLATCNAANDGLIRINESTSPHSLELCDNAAGGWQSVAAGASSLNLWTDLGGGRIHFTSGASQVGINNNNPGETLDVGGNIQTTGNVMLSNTKSVVWASGADITESGGVLAIDGGTAGAEISVNSAAVLFQANVFIVGTTSDNSTDSLTVEKADGTDILVVQNDGTVGIGTASPGQELDVVGDTNVSATYMIGGNTVVKAPDTAADMTILLGNSAGANVSSGDYNTVLGGGAGGTLTTGKNNILIGAHDTTAIDVPASGTNDFLNIGNFLLGDLANNRLGIGYSSTGAVSSFNDTLEVNGSIDATGAINATGNITSGATVSGVNVTASTRVTTDELYVNNTDNFIPGTCAAGNFNRWDGSSWVCSSDTGGAGGGSQDLEGVLTQGNDANTLTAVNLGGVAIGGVSFSSSGTQTLELDVTGDVGADNYCDADGNNCFTAASISGGGGGKWSDGTDAG